MDPEREEKAALAAKLIETSFVGRTSIVHIPDGRAFCGTFLCVDSGRNIILTNTDETRLNSEGRASTRNVGMVMIPGEHVIKVEIQHDAQRTQPPQVRTSAPAPMAQAGWPDDDDLYL